MVTARDVKEPKRSDEKKATPFDVMKNNTKGDRSVTETDANNLNDRWEEINNVYGSEYTKIQETQRTLKDKVNKIAKDQSNDYSELFKNLNLLDTTVKTEKQGLSELNEQYKKQIDLFFNNLPEKSTPAESLPDNLKKFYTMKDFKAKLPENHDAPYNENMHQQIYNNFTANLHKNYVSDNKSTLHKHLTSSDTLPDKYDQLIKKLEQTHLNAEQKQLIETLELLSASTGKNESANDINKLIEKLKEQNDKIGAGTETSIENLFDDFKESLSDIKAMKREAIQSIINKIKEIENPNRFSQYLKENKDSWIEYQRRSDDPIIHDHYTHLDNLHGFGNFIKNNDQSTNEVLSVISKEIETQKGNLEKYKIGEMNLEEVNQSIATHKETIDKIIDGMLNSISQTYNPNIEKVSNTLKTIADGNPFIDKCKERVANRKFQLDDPAEHSAIQAEYKKSRIHLQEWYEYIKSYYTHTENYLSGLKTQETALEENLKKYETCSINSDGYNNSMRDIKDKIDLQVNTIIDDIESKNKTQINKTITKLDKFKQDKPGINENPYINKLEEAINARIFALNKEQYDREQTQLDHLSTILSDKAKLRPVELESLSLLKTTFEDYQKDPSKHEDYNKAREDNLKEIDTHITGPIQDHLAQQDPYIVHQVYNEISKIGDRIPPIEKLKTFLDSIRDFPDHVDISESVMGNPELKYRVFNLPGIEKHARDVNNDLLHLQLTRATDINRAYQGFLESLQEEDSVKSDTNLINETKNIQNIWDEAMRIVNHDIVDQHTQFLEAVPNFNRHIKGIFYRIGELNITKLNKLATELHDNIAKSDETFQQRKDLRTNLETQENLQKLTKYQQDLQGMDTFLKDTKMPNELLSQYNSILNDFNTTFNEKSRRKDIDSHLAAITKDLSTLQEDWLNKLDISNIANQQTLYTLHEKLNDTNDNALLANLKTSIEKTCQELATKDNAYHEETHEDLKETYDHLDKLKDPLSEDEKANFAGLKLNIETDLPGAFKKYEEQDVSKEKWEAREIYYKSVAECKDNIKKVLDSHLQKLQSKDQLEDDDVEKVCQLYNDTETKMTKDEYYQQMHTTIAKSMDTLIEKYSTVNDKFSSNLSDIKSKFPEDNFDNFSTAIEEAKEKFKEYNDTASTKSKTDRFKEIVTSYKQCHEQLDKLPKNVQDAIKEHLKLDERTPKPSDTPIDTPQYHELPNLSFKDDKTKYKSDYENISTQYKDEQEKIKEKQNYVNNLTDDVFNKPKLVNDLNDNIKKRKEHLKKFHDELSKNINKGEIYEDNLGKAVKKWNDTVSKKLKKLDNEWDELKKEPSEQKRIRETLTPEQKTLFTKLEAELTASKEKAITYEQKIDDLMKEFENLKKDGIASTKLSKAADTAQSVSKTTAGLLDKIGSWLRHPFSRTKRRAYLEKAISDARTDVYDAVSGKDKSSGKSKLKNFFKKKWVRRTLKIVGATGLAVASMALAGHTGGASLVVGGMIGVMWYKMEKNDAKARMQKKSIKHDERFKDLTSEKSMSS